MNCCTADRRMCHPGLMDRRWKSYGAVEPKTRGVLRPGLWPDHAAQLPYPGFFARLFGAARLGTPLPIQVLETICMRALEIEPSRRQPSMAALVAELDDWLARYGDPLPE